MHGPEDAIKKWNDQVSTLKMCHTFRELQGLDGEPIDFEWKIFPGATALDLLHEIQADLQGKHVTPENFSDRKIFMSMLTTLSWKREEMKILVLLFQRRSKSTPQKSTMDILGTRRRKTSWYQGYATNYDGQWNLRASQMVEGSRTQDTQYSEG